MTGRRAALGFPLLAVVALVALAGLAGAADPLRVDAGSSQQTLGFDATLPVEAQVFGGEEPIEYNWTIEGESERFAEPTNRTTSVDLSGLAGTVNLTFTAEDASGSQASDHVLYHVAESLADPVDEPLAFTHGLPDEFVGASGLDQQTREVPFQVPAGADLVVARLTWEDGDPAVPVFGNDLDLVLLDPGDEETNARQGRTGGHPEQVDITDPEAGQWTARVEAWLTGPEDALLEIRVLASPAELPSARIRGPMLYGVEDTPTLHGDPRIENATATWDLDADGEPDATGNSTTLDADPGQTLVRYRATTSDGFESVIEETLEVTNQAEHAIAVRCRDKPLWNLSSMEYSWSLGTCWMHGGHHTYVLDDTFEIVGAEGRLFSVEQQFSPPTEYVQAPFETPLPIEISADGLDWERVHAAEYRFLEDPREEAPGLPTRQAVHFSFEIEATEAQMLRVHQPKSAAQGLSGFLDASRVFVLANATDTGDSPVSVEQGSLELSCEEDLMEAFFEEHPCWYGGINRYDAASFFHTYHPGPGTDVEEVEATVQVAPWRTDDWFTPILFPAQVSLDPSAPVDVEEEDVHAYSKQVTQTRVFVQASGDGVSWETLGSETVLFGERETFQIDVDEPVDGRFVRLVTDHHPLSEEYRASAPLHHPEAYFLDSHVTVTGTVPTGS